MNPNIKAFFYLIIFISSYSYGQMKQYNYKRELKGISEQWHKIILPDEIFGKTSQDLTDIRIFGITKNNDSVEAPYLLRSTEEKVSSKEVAFKRLNTSHNTKGYYFTLEIPTTEPVNKIKLDLKSQNFDWLVKLEGSHNQEEWFTIIENYRILSIKNELTNFQFTNLAFPNSKYRYYRLFINSKEIPQLNVASIGQNEIIEGTFRNFPISKIFKKENKQARQTEIDLELESPVPVSDIEIGISDSFDYYRPITIEYVTDSFKTEQGWKYNYSTLTSGTLNSIEKNKFKFSSTIIQRIRILIDNQNNQPLAIDTIHVRGSIHELVARFTEQAAYFMMYGNKGAARPQYDIDRFTENIPGILKTLELGNETLIQKDKIPSSDLLFKNKTWLWAIMSVIILLLGWFSVKMIRKSNHISTVSKG